MQTFLYPRPTHHVFKHTVIAAIAHRYAQRGIYITMDQARAILKAREATENTAHAKAEEAATPARMLRDMRAYAESGKAVEIAAEMRDYMKSRHTFF